MRNRLLTLALCFATIFMGCIGCSSTQESTQFKDAWKFTRLADSTAADTSFASVEFDDSSWDVVSLPHTANLEPLTVNDQWQGLCWYRKDFNISNYSSDKKYFIEFEAIMNKVEIWINGEKAKFYQGGYLPVVIDATPFVKGGNNVIALLLDNNDNAVTGPKPLKILDFNMYGGIYRNAHFTEKGNVYITNPILADKVASGGIFITTPVVDEKKSVANIKVHVANDSKEDKTIEFKHEIFNNNALVAEVTSKSYSVKAGSDVQSNESIDINNAKLWSPDAPNLYCVKTTVLSEGVALDSIDSRFGIREVTFQDNQIYLNGKKTYLRGVNRHQEYPYVGYALSDRAQYRDAKKIKDAGFDYIRLSHYPQSPAFMRACDELGLMVADAILGWQFYQENDAFKNQMYSSAKELVRRDRNHPCVLAWEVSLNETKMPVEFMEKLHNIVHSEYPGEKVYTCGWMPDVYDIYFQARQHRIGHPEEVTFEKPYMVSEYGDWEYYSTNAGLNQHQHSKEKRLELSSRQFRADGEERLLTQALNLQESHNDNMNIPATGDSYWVMYDYNRGYHDQIEASGIMDIFRLPKFGYYFYQSQKPVSSVNDAMLFIASYWSEKSATDVKVFSNCDQVALYLNDKLVAKQTPDNDKFSTNLNHPPFTFKVGKFEVGTLRAEGYIDGKKVAEGVVKTPQAPVALKCWLDTSDKAAKSDCNDVLFLYVAAVDKNGTICPEFTDEISVVVDAKCEIMNVDGIKTEAGIATALLRIGAESGTTALTATSGELKGEFTFDIE